MKKGGYQIIDLSAYKFTNGEPQIIKNVFNIIKNTKKVVLISGLTVDDTEYHDMFTVFMDYETFLCGLTQHEGNNICFVVNNDGDVTVNVSANVKPTNYLYGHEADKTVSYNGVVLPELPEFDKTTYPYTMILWNGNKTVNFLMCSTVPMSVKYPSGGSTYPHLYGIGSGSAISYRNEGGGVTWERFEGWDSEFDAGGLVVSSALVTLGWANYDVPYQSDMSTIALSASDPVITYENADVTINGVGYVGAILPKLPEWDKDTYPYAVINYSGSTYSFLTTTVPLYYGGESDGVCGSDNGTSFEYLLSYNTDNYFGGVPGEWTKVEETFEIEKDGYIYDDVFWSNYNIFNADDSVYLSATEPIQVYE